MSLFFICFSNQETPRFYDFLSSQLPIFKGCINKEHVWRAFGSMGIPNEGILARSALCMAWQCV